MAATVTDENAVNAFDDRKLKALIIAVAVAAIAGITIYLSKK